MNSRLIRICWNLAEDLPMAYIHMGSSGDALCNGEPSKITLAFPGEPLDFDKGEESGGLKLNPLHLVVSGLNRDSIKSRVFVAFGDGGAVLRLGEGKRLEVVSPGFIAVSQRFKLWEPITTGVLTISDKGARGEREDTAGPALAERALCIGAEVIKRDVVPDDVEMIRDKVLNWGREGIELILCTGGTGLSPRDVTPDAIMGIADKLVPGFGEMMRIKTSHANPRSFLSRGIGALVGKTLVLTFPGSRRGALECFEAVEEGIRHGVEIANGRAMECGNHG
ncbi:MogA/MoaB family molybdenum cofactor biosynthesis protein [Thermanaerovibrio velox]|uniref:MogA/MoaB family molybdenum cofactor biosynthesis protein n=1 Tax=Thermanaerovibrio velox TaxID=108007 RepID=UPI0012EA118C|nr:MogA/MoaB family molybdenum cofactor biosynthesis protein [Thermanaerovibrio velox]